MTSVRQVREWAVVLGAAPVLAFPAAVPAATIAILSIVVVWLVISARVQGVSLDARVGSLKGAWTVLTAMVLVGAAVSPYGDLTLPKLAGVVLGMLVLRALLLTATTAARARGFAWLYLAGGTLIVTVALLIRPNAAADDFNLTYVKYPALWAISERLPRLVNGLPGAERGVNLNALGGTTLFFLPLALAVAASGVRTAVTERRIVPALGATAAAGAVAVVAFGLLLSQSRTAWVSAACVLGVLAVLACSRRRPALAVILGSTAAAVTGALALWLWRNQPALSSGLVAFNRWDAWSVALDALRVHPVTGVGLGAFRRLAEVMQVGLPDPILPLVHAHNVFLQTALDTGVAGLAAYLALLVNATRQAYRVWRSAPLASDRALALGLWGGLFAVHIFGMMDSISLGAKVGVFLWAGIGLIAVLERTVAIHLVHLKGCSP